MKRNMSNEEQVNGKGGKAMKTRNQGQHGPIKTPGISRREFLTIGAATTAMAAVGPWIIIPGKAGHRVRSS